VGGTKEDGMKERDWRGKGEREKEAAEGKGIKKMEERVIHFTYFD